MGQRRRRPSAPGKIRRHAAKSDKIVKDAIAAVNGRKTARTISDTNDDQLQHVTMSAVRKIMPIQARLELVKKELREAYSQAKGQSVARKDIDELIKMKKLGVEGAEAEAKRLARLARWSGSPFGAQGDLFSELNRDQVLRAQGHAAAMDDQPCRPPDHLNNDDQQEWISGFHAGQTVRNEVLAAQFGPLGDQPGTTVERPATVQ